MFVVLLVMAPSSQELEPPANPGRFTLTAPPDATPTLQAANGGARPRSLTSRLRFCAVAVSSTSSLAPLRPRSRSRSSPRMRFIWANRISTFLRSRRDCWKASVFANARTLSRTSSLRSRVTLQCGRRTLLSQQCNSISGMARLTSRQGHLRRSGSERCCLIADGASSI